MILVLSKLVGSHGDKWCCDDDDDDVDDNDDDDDDLENTDMFCASATCSFRMRAEKVRQQQNSERERESD